MICSRQMHDERHHCSFHSKRGKELLPEETMWPEENITFTCAGLSESHPQPKVVIHCDGGWVLEHWKVCRTQRHQGVIYKLAAPALIKTDVKQRLRLFFPIEADAGVSSCSRFKTSPIAATAAQWRFTGYSLSVWITKSPTADWWQLWGLFLSLSFFRSFFLSLQCIQSSRGRRGMRRANWSLPR